MAILRADLILIEKKQASSRTKAQELIEQGCVQFVVNGKKKVIKNSNEKFELDQLSEILISPNSVEKYVSRAGLKLEGAITKYNLNVLGKVALDIGLSTGGFTDCLIGLGIDKVIGIDVGHGQIHSKLQGHRKLVAIEGLNAKEMKSNSVFLDEMPKAGFDLLVMDLSFISVLAVLPFALDVLAPSAHLIILIKPQFEAGPNALDKNGIIRDPKLYPELLQRLASGIERLGCKIEMQFESFPPGKDGNREFFFCAKKT